MHPNLRPVSSFRQENLKIRFKKKRPYVSFTDGYTIQEIVMEWTPVPNPIMWGDDIEIPEFELGGVEPEQCLIDYATGREGESHCLYR